MTALTDTAILVRLHQLAKREGITPEQAQERIRWIAMRTPFTMADVLLAAERHTLEAIDAHTLEHGTLPADEHLADIKPGVRDLVVALRYLQSDAVKR